ncbi:acyl-CoA dehydrogenase family protein [Streptomyces microflavus]|uniref:acyl-CoA dehydrogenase family protein n=1 Tax=Streptomyces microflavus TaxID=1919 RepID=UPI0038146D25
MRRELVVNVITARRGQMLYRLLWQAGLLVHARFLAPLAGERSGKGHRRPTHPAGNGDLDATHRATRLLADEGTRAFAEADAAGLALTSAERGRAALAVCAAKVMSSRTATEATSRIFEFTGARATARSSGLDRFWRDARTLTLHDPLVYKARELGTPFLIAKFPVIMAYS